MTLDGWRLYAAVAACAAVVYLGVLWNRFAMDDLYIVVHNPLVHDPRGLWRAFTQPYWPPDLGGKMYRPLTVASYALDWQLHSAAWFHGMNVAWHAGVSLTVAALARRWLGPAAALAAGLIFAVHPVHVEAVANVIGRAELMAALFACLAVYAALVRESVGWCAVALVAGLLSKENTAVVPALVVSAWVVGVAPRPSRRKAIAFALSWVVVGALYAGVRGEVLHPYGRFLNVAPAFVGQGPVAYRLTGVAALADLVRLLVFPLTLRADYSPAERTIVRSALDGRLLLGLVCLVLWAALLAIAWRRRRRAEALGIAWIGVAFLPVANLLFPTGVVIAERTLYLPSAGFALAAGGWLAGLPPRRYWALLGLLVAAGGVRSALRVPVWRSDLSVTLSILKDSPRSYVGPARTGALMLASGDPAKALTALQTAIGIFDHGHTTYIAAADAAFATGHSDLAHQYMERADRLCVGCPGGYNAEARAALARGDTATADSLLAHVRALEAR